jgi:hypothetical protein
VPEQPPVPDWNLEFKDPQIQREYQSLSTSWDLAESNKFLRDSQQRLLQFWLRNRGAETTSGNPAGAWASRDMGMMAWEKLVSRIMSDPGICNIMTNYMRSIEILAKKSWNLLFQQVIAARGLERYKHAGGSIELLSMLAKASGSAEVQSFRLRVKRELQSGAIRRASPAEVAASQEFLRKLNG